MDSSTLREIWMPLSLRRIQEKADLHWKQLNHELSSVGKSATDFVAQDSRSDEGLWDERQLETRPGCLLWTASGCSRWALLPCKRAQKLFTECSMHVSITNVFIMAISFCLWIFYLCTERINFTQGNYELIQITPHKYEWCSVFWTGDTERYKYIQ